jgi:hypothetical protein
MYQAPLSDDRDFCSSRAESAPLHACPPPLVRSIRGIGSASSDRAFDPSRDFGFGLDADDPIDLTPSFEHQDGREAVKVEPLRRRLILVGVDPGEPDRPASSDASSSIAGEILRQGPHYAAHTSRTTGSGNRSISAANVASVTVTGLESAGRGVLHRPQTGARPRPIFMPGFP